MAAPRAQHTAITELLQRGVPIWEVAGYMHETNDKQVFRRDGRAGEISWARQATTVVLVNIIVLAGLLLATEAGIRLFRRNYEFYSRTEPGQ